MAEDTPASCAGQAILMRSNSAQRFSALTVLSDD